SANIRIDERQAKGYELKPFKEVFERYLMPEGGDLSVPPSHTEVKPPNSIRPKGKLGTDAKTPVFIGVGTVGRIENPKPGGEVYDDPVNDSIIAEAMEVFDATIVND